MADKKTLTQDEIEAIARDAMQDAVSFAESEIAPARLKAQRYYDGEVDIGEEEGRSKVVCTKVRDSIRQVKPSLMRIFMSSGKPVEYTPTGPDDVAFTEQATTYAHYAYRESNGYRVLADVIHDALLKKMGVAKVFWDTSRETEIYTLTGLGDDEFTMIASDPSIEVIEHSHDTVAAETEVGPIEVTTHDMKISRTVEGGKLLIESVPPEEFFFSSGARSQDDSYILAHRTEKRVSDLVEMGIDFDVAKELSPIEGGMDDEEKIERNDYYDTNDDENIQDESMKMVAFTEAYMKIDAEGTGSPQLYRLWLGGNDYQLLDYEPFGYDPFAIFEVDPEPHSIIGNSLADLIINDQDATTAALRGIIDNVALTNNPSIEVVEKMVNMDDVLNNEIGSIKRVKQAGSINPLAVPFVAGATLPALQYLDDMVEAKTGVSRASMGLDPDALQNTTATAAQLTAQQGAGQIEVMAGNLANGGMRKMFRTILKLLVENSDDVTMMRLSGNNFVEVDPRSWNANMDVTVNVGLGTGKEDEKLMALQQTLQTQMNIWQSYGPGNGLVSMTNMRNTLEDMLAISGLRNADRYYAPMNPQLEQQLITQQQQAQGQQQPDPYVQAETIKAQQRSQDTQLKMQLEAQKAIAEDDRKRDEMDQELILGAAKILGEYGTKVDVEQVKQMHAEPRYPQAQPTQAATGSRF